MPEADWQSIRDAGQIPVARGLVSFGICHALVEEFPDLKDVLLEIPAPGIVKCIALDDGGCTVYDLDGKQG